MTAQIIPLAGWDTWSEVMERAGHRCQCGRCPKHRRDPDQRCQATTETAKLTAGPPNPGPDPARVMTSEVSGLVAWCGPCWDAAVSVARKHAREAAREVRQEDTETLF